MLHQQKSQERQEEAEIKMLRIRNESMEKQLIFGDKCKEADEKGFEHENQRGSSWCREGGREDEGVSGEDFDNRLRWFKIVI